VVVVVVVVGVGVGGAVVVAVAGAVVVVVAGGVVVGVGVGVALNNVSRLSRDKWCPGFFMFFKHLTNKPSPAILSLRET
jgi:hypothetical protein